MLKIFIISTSVLDEVEALSMNSVAVCYFVCSRNLRVVQ